MNKKIWFIQIKGRQQNLRDMADKKTTYAVSMLYEPNKKGKWSCSTDTSIEIIYRGIAVTFNKAVAAALKCAKVDGMKNPEVISVNRYGDCHFGTGDKQ